jgi:hypothetical protein
VPRSTSSVAIIFSFLPLRTSGTCHQDGDDTLDDIGSVPKQE